MLKFNLTTNEKEGFKLTTQAESESERETLEELAKLLISKIDKITVKVGSDYNQDF